MSLEGILPFSAAVRKKQHNQRMLAEFGVGKRALDQGDDVSDVRIVVTGFSLVGRRGFLAEQHRDNRIIFRAPTLTSFKAHIQA